MHLFVYKILSSEIHLPSCDQEWQIPDDAAFPMPSFVFFLLEPLEEQEASYFAEFDNISSFLITSIFITPQTFVLILSYFVQE